MVSVGPPFELLDPIGLDEFNQALDWSYQNIDIRWVWLMRMGLDG